MSGWLVQDGYWADVIWSDEGGCFVGRLRGTGYDTANFRGETPAEMREAFARAVRDHVATRGE